MKELICQTPNEMRCMKKINVDSSLCLKPCSGLVVTSFSKSKINKNLEHIFPDYMAYNNYKKITAYPSGYKGTEVKIF